MYCTYVDRLYRLLVEVYFSLDKFLSTVRYDRDYTRVFGSHIMFVYCEVRMVSKTNKLLLIHFVFALYFFKYYLYLYDTGTGTYRTQQN